MIDTRTIIPFPIDDIQQERIQSEPTEQLLSNITPFPVQHHTTLPSNNGLRGILSSFGPGLIRKPSLWQECEDASGLGTQTYLLTPNGARLALKGKGATRKAIEVYIDNMIGAEGLKVALTLMATWYKQTQADNPKASATIFLRQFLLDMGYARMEANNKDVQRKIYYCILYLTHLAAIAKETRYIPENAKKPQGKKIRTSKTIEWTPLFTLKSKAEEAEGLPVVPESFTYGIGESFFAEMFGEEKHFFQLPTVDALKYNAKNDAHELCLVFYLSNMIVVSHASFVAHLLTLVFHAGLHREQDFNQDKNRLRFLDQVLLAIEHLEMDGWIKREAQSIIDQVLAIDLLSQSCKPDEIANTTHDRIQEAYADLLTSLTAKELKSRKTALLKQLADDSQAYGKIELTGGALLETQAKKIKRSRAVAVARQQRAIEASMKRAVKNA